MPIYEYECPRCSSRFELKRSFSDNGSVSCPKCGCAAERIFSPVPVIFKGSGFYTTDHRGNHSHSAPTGSTEEADAGSEKETTTESTETTS
ncbi:FmdB family zinc ribbon protein [Chloroflexota bacterium]